MRKELIGWELRKLWSLPMIPVFLALCMAFQLVLILTWRYGHWGGEYVQYVEEVTGEAGGLMGREFDQKAAALSSAPYKELLIAQTAGAEDILEDFDTGELAEYYIGKFRMTGAVETALERKYEGLQERIRELAASDASLSLNAAGMTKPLWEELFERLCKILLTQGLLLAVLTALYVCGSEKMNRTACLVYTSHRGRRIQREKAAAGLLSSVLSYGILAGTTVLGFQAAWRPGKIWQASMSSQFYYVGDLGVKLPFVAQLDFTVAGYLAATIFLGLFVVVLFYGLGYCAALFAGNAYQGFLMVLLLVAVNFEGIMITGDSGQWLLYESMQWTPAAFWWNQPVWFSELGASTLVPWQDCKVAVFCMVLCGLALLGAFRHFYNKQL